MRGPGMGGGFGRGFASKNAGNLPFAGVPPELAERAAKVLESEPDHPPLAIEFDQVSPQTRPLTIFNFIAPHWRAIAFAVFIVVLEIVCVQIGPYLTRLGIDQGINKGDVRALLVIAAVFCLAIAASVGLSFVRHIWLGRLGENLMLKLRLRVFSHLQRMDLAFYTGEKVGRLMTRMTSDIEALSALLHEGLINLLVQILTMGFVGGMLFAMNQRLACVVALAVLPLMTVMTLVFRAASDKGYNRVRERIAEVLADFQESLNGIRVIAALNRQIKNIADHTRILGAYRDSNIYTARVSSLYSAGTDLVSVGGIAMILFFGGRMYLAGQLTIGELTAFVLYLTAFFTPIQQMVQLYNTYQQGRAAVVKLRDLLSTQPSVAERPDARPLPAIEGRIVFERVTFEYEPGRPVIEGVDLTVEPGETFALVGATGAGKSTLAKLIVRFYDPLQGRVLIDGRDIRDFRLDSIRRQFGFVPQEPFLFAGSLKDNVAFARPEATDEEVIEACRAVGIGPLIQRLPEGIATPIHERGASLAAGERQLIALARALLAQPRVIVLDEATSNLDLASEARIEKALDILLSGRTSIIIAHRLSTAMRADRIAVFEHGRLAELGAHDELVARGGLYAAMFKTWNDHAGA